MPDALLHYVNNVNRTNADIVKSGWEAHYYDGRMIAYSNDEDVSTTDCASYFILVQATQYSTFIWNTLFARRIISDVHFDTSLCWLEDHIFSYQCFLKAKSFALIKDVTYRYMVRKRTSLSSVKDPYMICKAANKEIRLKQRILFRDISNQIEKEWNDYYNKIDKAINVIYEDNTSYEYRKRFCNTVVLSSELHITSLANIFFNPEIPFSIRDICLMARIKMKKTKKSIKSIIKSHSFK